MLSPKSGGFGHVAQIMFVHRGCIDTTITAINKAIAQAVSKVIPTIG